MDPTNTALIVWLVTLAQVNAAGSAPEQEWFAAGGAQTQSYRDISRTRRPVDASPVEWRGTGPLFTVGFERRTRTRLHRATLDVGVTRSMAYAGPVRRVGAPDADGMRRLEGRYEYRRYPFDDVFVRGLDVGVGVQGIGRHFSFTRTASSFGTHRGADLTMAIACVAAARVRRWTRWSADIEWINGIGSVRAHERVDVDPLADAQRWGGAWLTDLSARLTLHMTERTGLTVSYVRADEGTVVSKNSYATAQRRLAVGVTYAR